jgi:chorismate--pyruvate lyase
MMNNQTNLKLAPPQLLSWISSEDSLTDELLKITGDAELAVLSHLWVHSGWWDKYVLDIQNQFILQREIIMKSHDTPCWYARTIVQESVYHENTDFFNRLENCSLNVLLFKEKLASRQSKFIYSINKNDLEFHWIRKALLHLNPMKGGMLPEDIQLWGRRSCFLINNQSPFYLIEFFLPGFLDVLSS